MDGKFNLASLGRMRAKTIIVRLFFCAVYINDILINTFLYNNVHKIYENAATLAMKLY